MGVEFRDNVAIFTQTISVEEAERVFEWLLETEEPIVDLKECFHIHTALLQALLLVKPKLVLPEEEEFRAWLEAHVS